MMNIVWFTMVVIGIVAAIINPNVNIHVITEATASAAEQTVAITIGMAGLLAFWSGMMRIAEKAGFVQLLSRSLTPIIKRLFPSIPQQHDAFGAIALAISANLLGLGNAATPLGLRAMKQLKTLNPYDDEANDAMCTFVALITSGLTVVPTTIIALRAVYGSTNPTAFVGTAIVATTCGTIAALVLDRLLRHRSASL